MLYASPMVTSRAWERQRTALRAEIVATARTLFVRDGFEATTVDRIAEAVGISRRSFFRYFGTKEDVVLSDLVARGDAIAAALAGRPPGEGPWEALRAAMLDARSEVFHDAVADLAFGRMLQETPALRARLFEKRLHWHEALVPLVAGRIEAPGAPLAAAAIVSAALSCLDVASEAWIASEGTADLVQLYDSAVAAIRL